MHMFKLVCFAAVRWGPNIANLVELLADLPAQAVSHFTVTSSTLFALDCSILLWLAVVLNSIPR